MKPILINFTDEQGNITKTFSACSIKTGTMDNVFDIAEKAQELENTQDIKMIRAFYKDLKAIVVEVFGNQFTYDELNKNVETNELMNVFNGLCKNLQGAMVKK